jgi:hypothetical protein
MAFPQFSRQILLSKSEWEKCKCKEPNTQLNSKKRQFVKLSTGSLCNRCSQATRNWGKPALDLGQEVQGWQ